MRSHPIRVKPRTIQASELGTFLFCRRAWWYRLQGEQPANQSDLLRGERHHRRHGLALRAARLLSVLAGLLFLAALLYLLWQRLL